MSTVPGTEIPNFGSQYDRNFLKKTKQNKKQTSCKPLVKFFLKIDDWDGAKVNPGEVLVKNNFTVGCK